MWLCIAPSTARRSAKTLLSTVNMDIHVILGVGDKIHVGEGGKEWCPIYM